MLFYEKLEVSVAKLNKANLKKTLYYLQRNGLRETWISVRERLTETDRYFFVPCSEAELVRQSDRKWEKPITFSIVVPLYRTPEAYLNRMITSVMQQSYPHWELILADATEAVFAAVYLDGGIGSARKIIQKFILSREVAGLTKPRDYKTALQELVQRESGQVLAYQLVGEEGPDHDKRFFVEVDLNGTPVGSGQGRSKKEAEQMAAKAAIGKLGG